MYKIFTVGSYFFIVDSVSGDSYEAKAQDVLVRKASENSSTFYISNVNGWDKRKAIEFSNILDKNGIAYTDVATWESFYTGFNTALGGSNANDFTGWAQYSDTQYTVGSPFTIAANTITDLPNNAGNKIEIQKPIDVPSFYDEILQKIPGKNGDGLSWAIELKVVPSVAADFVELSIDIGGGVGEIYKTLYTFPKGSGVVRNIIYSIPSAYTLGTWEANGGQVKINSNGSCDIYAIRYVITRTHKAR